MKVASATEFWNVFAERFAKISTKRVAPGRRAWTAFMYQFLHEDLRRKLRFWCECRSEHPDQQKTVRGERLHIDFFWYSRANGNGGDFDPPALVIEHENVRERLKYNLWKLSQLAAPLRVLIGYSQPGLVDETARDLFDMAARSNLFAPAGSEDLILLSDYRDTQRFHGWLRRRGMSWAELHGNMDEAALHPAEPRGEVSAES